MLQTKPFRHQRIYGAGYYAGLQAAKGAEQEIRAYKSPYWPYNGNTYILKSQAQWAIFFDALEIKFASHCTVSSGPEIRLACYQQIFVPHFYLHDIGFFDVSKIDWSHFAQHSKRDIFSCSGDFPSPEQIQETSVDWDDDQDFAHKYFADGGGDTNHQFCQCLKCEKIGLQFSARANRLCSCGEGDGWDVGHGATPSLLKAYARAFYYFDAHPK